MQHYRELSSEWAPPSERPQRRFQTKNGFDIGEKHFNIAYRTVVYNMTVT